MMGWLKTAIGSGTCSESVNAVALPGTPSASARQRVGLPPSRGGVPFGPWLGVASPAALGRPAGPTRPVN